MILITRSGARFSVGLGSHLCGLRIIGYELGPRDYEAQARHPSEFEQWLTDDVHTRFVPGCMCHWAPRITREDWDNACRGLGTRP